MKRIIAGVLLLLILVSSFVLTSCGEGGGGSGSGDESSLNSITNSNENPGETTAEEGDVPEINATDYKGAEFTILYPMWSLYNNYYFAEEANGDAMNDAIFERTSKIEEILNIKIKTYMPGNITTIKPEITKVVMAGLDTYDFMLTHCISDLVSFVGDGVIVNWNSIPAVNMTKSYWNQTLKKSHELNGVLGYAVNDFILPDVNSIFFNKSLVEGLNLESPYQVVTSGRWTWDKLIEMAKSGARDLNGDGVFDDQDQYGFVGELGWQFTDVPTSCGVNVVEINDENTPVLTINSPKTVNILQTVYSMLKSKDIAYTWIYDIKYDPNVDGIPPIDFNAGKALYYLVPLSLAKKFRTMDVEFGIVPMPKYDEAQKDYISLNWSGYMTVPATAKDFELTGKVAELLGYYNGKIVHPAFYDILLGQKISRDTESLEMLDIIFKNTIYDLGVTLDLAIVVDVLKKDGNFASAYASKEPAFEKAINNYIKACDDYAAANGGK